jgi:sigma-B regulation protein RsbU (phosphoserine phosphatase)
MFTTAFYGILDTGTGLIRYANAGHNPPLVLRADAGVEELPATDAMALGVFEDVDYPVRLAQLNPGDSLLCFTDGVTEAINGAGDLFGDERLAALLAHQAHQHPMEIFAGVITDVDGYMGLAPMADDVTLLVLRYNG